MCIVYKLNMNFVPIPNKMNILYFIVFEIGIVLVVDVVVVVDIIVRVLVVVTLPATSDI